MAAPKSGRDTVEAVELEHQSQLHQIDTVTTEIHHLSDKVYDGDQALEILRTQYEPYSPEEEKKVLRKIDKRLIPFMVIINGLQFVDKNTISFAATYGIAKQAHLKGQQFSSLITIFAMAYLAAQYPSNWLMQKLPTGKYIMANFLLWGATLAATAGATNFGTLAAARFFLGVFEACLFPGFVLLTSSWWKREEQVSRTAIWYCANGLFGAPAAVVFWGVAHIDFGHMFPYQWMFLIFGVLTIVLGCVLWWLFPDSPVTAKFLSERERLIAVERLQSNNTGVKNNHHKREQVVELLFDLKIWLLILGIFIHNLTGPLQTTFAGVIIKGFGYSTYDAVLLNIPPGVVMAGSVLTVGAILSTKWGVNKRHLLIIICYIPGVVACLILILVPLTASTKGVHLFAVFFVVIPAASSGLMYTLLASNIAGYTKKTVAGALFYISQAAGTAIGPQAFLQSQAPRYRTGIVVCLVAFSANIVLFSVIWVLYSSENTRRRADVSDMGEGRDVGDLITAFSDLTDKQNKKMWYIT